jgi:hypothetical protein
MRRIEGFIKTSIDDVPEKQTPLDQIQALDAENAILLKANA